MKLLNKSEAFVVTYDGLDYNIKPGINEAVKVLAHHIVEQANKWGFDVQFVDDTATDEMFKSAKEEVKEEKKEVEKPKTTKTKK